MIIVIEKTDELRGSIQAPSSKSYTHRAIIASSLSTGKSRIVSPLFCDDTEATIKACLSLGASIEKKEHNLVIVGSSHLKAPESEIDCGDSASTIRFITPVSALAVGVTVLTGSPSLRGRPMGPLVSSLIDLGVNCTSHGGYPPVKIFGGKIKGGETRLVGDISSQFITGLLFACPLAEANSSLNLTTPPVSRLYIKLTLHILSGHEIKVKTSNNFIKFDVPCGQRYSSVNHFVPGDFSSASFLLAAAAVTNSHITVKNLNAKPWQPDTQIIEILKKMNVQVKKRKNEIEILGGRLKSICINARDIPDLVPICTVLGCFAEGVTQIFGAERLRIKESDRLSALSSQLSKMGAKIVETEDGLKVRGPCKLHGATINPYNDHRIAMACTVAALNAKGKTKILEAECVNKSYPGFFGDLRSIGVKINGG